ncbi:MAG: VTT domain-containing protein [Bryobacteraceae bacterium]|nr:VTT domain-containing protein [Bryobacteraceae bacterium]
MTDLVEKIARHGPALVALVCFLEAVGFPLPAAVALLAAGALIALGKMAWQPAAAGVFAAFVVADLLLYSLGRFTGWWLLGAICRLSANRESCILNAARTFYKRGRAVMLFAKFVPGLAAMAAPLAGSMRMPLREFIGLDAAGILLYAGTYVSIGYIFSDMLAVIVGALAHLGKVAELLLATAVILFVAHRIWTVRRLREADTAPRVTVDQVLHQLRQGDALIADVRSHGYYDRGSTRIKGSVRLEPNRLPEALAELPQDKKIYLYCT